MKAWKNNILIEFLHHPNLAPLKYRPNALYNAFIKINVLEPGDILALINLILTLYSIYHTISAITTKFFTDHELTNETSLEELSQYAPEILELLTTSTPLADKEKRRQARNHLQKEYKFSKKQAFALIPHERIGQSKRQVTSKEVGNIIYA
ncbi:integrase: PROVISIONAL [Gigaspora margarita]|uniref:Integrase: PROVISIONAL n=1 Tax=Gigaspora margarita TaxID=4874 RepID=A0A8H3XGH0_GIGMA|nr:integrase: PROVISIONAL [Gigaspora margarita]